MTHAGNDMDCTALSMRRYFWVAMPRLEGGEELSDSEAAPSSGAIWHYVNCQGGALCNGGARVGSRSSCGPGCSDVGACAPALAAGDGLMSL